MADLFVSSPEGIGQRFEIIGPFTSGDDAQAWKDRQDPDEDEH